MKKTIDTPVVASKINFATKKKDVNPCNNRTVEYSQIAEKKIANKNVGHVRFGTLIGEYTESYFEASHPCDTKGKVYKFRVSIDNNDNPLITKNIDNSEHLVVLPCPDFCTNTIPDES